MSCWEAEPHRRPTFQTLEARLSKPLQGIIAWEEMVRLLLLEPT